MDKTNYSGAKDQQAANTHMEQVREILFGAQLKDMELRFKRQEERFLREIHDVKDSLRKRLDSLENFMKSEISSLLDRLKRENEEREAEQKTEQRERLEAIQTEQRERAEALKAEEHDRQEAVARLNSDLANVSETFERKLAKLSGTLDTAERDLRSLLLSESGSLTDKIENKYADALNVIAKTAAQIRNDMVYRAALSGMFAEMVGGLSKAWNEENLTIDLAREREEGPVLAVEEDRPQEEEEPENELLPKVIQVGSADNY